MWKYIGKERPSFAQEPMEGQESVWDYPRPPIIGNEKRDVVISWKEVEIARTNKALKVCETASPPTYYIPMDDVNMDVLSKDSGLSFCEWKGQAIYWQVHIYGEKFSKIAWSYPIPSKDFEFIRNHLAFYATPFNCFLGGEKVLPQDGSGFYGGWVTKDIVGPWKGGSDPRAQGL